MKIAFPVQQNQGLDSPVYTHFGSAPRFIIVNTGADTFETVDNIHFHHRHGECRPMQALGGHRVDAVVAGGIGGGALGKLQAAGVKVFRALDGSISDNLAVMKSGKLPEFSLRMTCAGHSEDGECRH